MGPQLEVLQKNNHSKSAVLVLHGYGANNQDLFPLADYFDRSHKFDWHFANGPLRIPFNAWMEGRAWFSIDLQEIEESMRTGKLREFAGRIPPELKTTLDQLENYLIKLEDQYESIVLAGFSQGAMMCSHLLARRSGKIKGALLLSGALVAKSLFDEHLAEHQLRVPIFQSHGKSDQVLDIRLGEELKNHLEFKKFPVQFHQFSGGHEIPMDVINLGANFLSSLNTSHS